jgi:hypothetical protein
MDGIPLILTESMTMTPADYQLHYNAPTVLGWCLWGERHKFVPLSSTRFASAETTWQFMPLPLEGIEGEVMEIVFATQAYMDQPWILHTKVVKILSSGRLQVTLARGSYTMDSVDSFFETS